MVIVRAHLGNDRAADAHALLRGREPSFLSSDEDRVTAAQACLAAGSPQDALRFAPEAGGPALMVRARALLMLERNDEGRSAYEQAVAVSAALENLDLKTALGAKDRKVHRGGGPRLRVIETVATAEDDTRRVLHPERDPVGFSEVGGLDEVKEQIRRRIILPFQKPSLFERFKKRVGGGILMYGPPGVGKTLIARATAGECRARFFNVAISDVLDMYIGESEQKLHALFEKARSSAPSVLFFDEVEALGGKRQFSRESTTAKLVSQFLAEMDGFSQNNAGVLILGATNVPWAVDAAFRRPGRFDRFLFVPPPDRAARETILNIHLAERPVAPDVDVPWLARNSSGFSGADLCNLVETAADEAIHASIESGMEVPMDGSHFKTALKEVKPTTTEWLTTARNHARYSNDSGQYDDVLTFLERHGRN